MGFDFEEMTTAFERIETEHRTRNPSPDIRHPLPSTDALLHAVAELTKLFERLGAGFGFVKRDLSSKTALLARYAAGGAGVYADVNELLVKEKRDGECVVRSDGGPGGARTVLRLMWALRFADGLLGDVGKGDSLRVAVCRAYDDALAEHHSWPVRRSVKAACVLLPGRDVFLERIGVAEERQEEYLERLKGSLSMLVKRMYCVYGELGLLGLA